MCYTGNMILGIDEVGRGVWAGPLVVGAVVLGETTVDGLTDSKKLSDKKRRALDVIIREQASGYGLGWVTPAEIDEIGLSAALKLATRRAVEQVKTPYSEIIIDGTVNFLADTGKGRYVTTMKKADLLIASVSAASIIAKVARDDYMIDQAKLYPGFGFENHVGYGTENHRLAINNFGITPLHRMSVKPVATFVNNRKVVLRNTDSDGLTTRAVGDKAENLVTEYLKNNSHQILERNFRTRYCEIDIVSLYKNVIHFTEVKYRKSVKNGDGLAAITPAKLRQMTKAAEIFTHNKNLQNLDRVLAVASVNPDGVESWFILE